MTDLFAASKTYRPRRTILSADMNTELAALVTAFNLLGTAPSVGRNGVGSAFAVGDATENYHAVSKTQFDAAVSGFSTQLVDDANATLTDGVPADLSMQNRTATRTITLCQNPSNGQILRVRDTDNAAATNLITLSRNTRSINGAAEDLTIDIDGAIVTLVYDLSATNWIIVEVTALGVT